MRTLNSNETDQVSGGEWEIGFDFGVVEGSLSGPESIQDIASGIGDIYGGAVDAMADFFTWLDPAGFYSSCGGGGGR
jgi:hypothetical protein